MAIESLGYEGTLGHGVTWADLQYALGNRYYVEDPTALQPTPIVGGLSLGAGRFGGWGIADELTAPQNLTWAGPGSGETRYYLVCARRTWADSETTFVVLDPGWLTVPTTLPAPGVGALVYNKTPGDVDDQPLFVVPWSFGNSQPSPPLDIRLIGGHESYVAGHDLALGYANWAGVVIQRGARTYRRILEDGALAWSITDPAGTARPLTVFSGADVMTPAADWTLISAEAIRDGNHVDLYWTLSRTGATITPNAYGEIGDQPIATVAAAHRPSRQLLFGGLYRSATGVQTGGWYLHPNGSLALQALAPGYPLVKMPANSWSVWGHRSYLRIG